MRSERRRIAIDFIEKHPLRPFLVDANIKTLTSRFTQAVFGLLQGTLQKSVCVASFNFKKNCNDKQASSPFFVTDPQSGGKTSYVRVIFKEVSTGMEVNSETVFTTGGGLIRPECVVLHASGLLFAPDWTRTGGISILAPIGKRFRLLAIGEIPNGDSAIRANGIALESGGSFLIAHLGSEEGAIYRLFADGSFETVTDTVDGVPMPPANFVATDSKGRHWITVSTRKIPRALDYNPDANSGFIALHVNGETRVVADGLGYTNECLLSEDERTLWVNETFARRLTAFDIVGDSLTNRRTIAQFGVGTFPDGLTQAADGTLFVTSIVSNRVLRVWPDGRIETVLEDSDAAHIAWVEAAFQAGDMGRQHLDTLRSKVLKNISNLAFGGADLKTAYLGCLLGDTIAAFDSPVAGRAMPHWSCDLGPLARYLED